MTSRRAIAVCLLSCAVVSACSGSGDGTDDDAGEPTTTSGAAATSVPAEPPPVPARYEGHRSEVYADPVNWLCRPDQDDLCDSGLDSTVVDADGTLTEQPWTADDDAPIDCFYVYPTISTDPGEISDRVPGDAERFVTLNQAARLGEVCRVFAPVYRQRTLAGLSGALAGSGLTTTTVAGELTPGEADVRDAFAHYMANDNDGRGVVLIGHSQGASVLRGLIRDEIDGDDEVRDRLVAAYLAGSALSVPEGEDVGGEFSNVALCRSEDQVGCAVSWASFRSDAPPPADSLFGRPRTGDGVAACNSPASLAGGSVELHSYFPSSASASIMTPPGDGGTDAASETAGWVTGVGITTPFVTTPGLVRGECVEHDGFHYLAVEVLGDPADPRADDIPGDLTPQWGLHLQDVNLVMGDIIELVGSQSVAWTAAH